jgi:hypothetical protein
MTCSEILGLPMLPPASRPASHSAWLSIHPREEEPLVHVLKRLALMVVLAAAALTALPIAAVPSANLAAACPATDNGNWGNKPGGC